MTSPVESCSPPAGTPEARRERLAGLLGAARAGRRDALDEIVAELTPMLWHLARTYRLDRATCEDVVQTTWLTLLRHLDAIRSPDALVGWLVTVTRREALRVGDLSRRQPTVDEESLDRLPDAGIPVDDRLVADERRRLLWSAVRRLSERCRDLLRVVAFVDRPSYDAVAEALGMPRGSIGPTRGRCLARLREVLAADPRWSWQ